MQDRKRHTLIHQIAIKLLSDGITSKNYTQAEAIKIISRTCTPNKLTDLIIYKEIEVINEIINEEAEIYKLSIPKKPKRKSVGDTGLSLF